MIAIKTPIRGLSVLLLLHLLAGCAVLDLAGAAVDVAFDTTEKAVNEVDSFVAGE